MAKKERDHSAFLELKASLRAKSPGNCYVFFGEEVFLLQHYLSQLKKLLLDDLTESFNSHKLTAETFTARAFADAVENLPMMAEHTFVQVDDVDLFKLPEADREVLIDVLGDIPDYCTVVFTYITEPWNPDKRLKKLWDAISQAATIVLFEKQEQRDLIAWVTRHFAVRNKHIHPELCAYLINITDGTMTSLASEIQKISAYSGAEEICRADIDAVTEPVLDAVVFQLTGYLGQGNYASALERLRQLLKMQEDPLRILGALGLHFRRLSAARLLMDSGKGVQELIKLYKIQEYPARKILEEARRISADFCRNALNLVVETDVRIKTSFDDAERLLEVLILNLSQEGSHG